jgi:enoyl-CoA hydratase
VTEASSPLTWTAADGIFVVRLANPPVNALAPRLLDELDAALDAFATDSGRVLVITSSVEGFFAAGADIKTMVAIDREGFVAYGHQLRSVVERIASLDQPSVAVVEGRALGGGMELALACTLRVAARGGRMGLPEAKIGLIPSAGATQRLPRYIGRGRALELMLSGREVDADEALRIGLVDRVADAGRAEADAVALAGTLAALSRPALRDVIRCVDDSADLPMAAGLAGEVVRMEALFDGPDVHEGMQAFVEKRPPRFS